jgi:hypothetical protein
VLDNDHIGAEAQAEIRTEAPVRGLAATPAAPRGAPARRSEVPPRHTTTRSTPDGTDERRRGVINRTYGLDEGTIEMIEDLASALGITRAEAIARAIADFHEVHRREVDERIEAEYRAKLARRKR